MTKWAWELPLSHVAASTSSTNSNVAAAIVERRGGMLIHGSIIAREYGIPCVTGVPHATSFIHTGNHVTVDGYLGIVIVA